MEKIANGNEMCYNGDESGMKGYAIAPIDGFFRKFPDDGDLSKTYLCCCAANAATAKSKIDQIISELTDYEKGQLLLMILESGIPSKTARNEEE